MKKLNTLLLVAGVLVIGTCTAALAQDMDPIAVLKSDAPLVDKIDACRILSQKGTAEAVPVLAPLLLDEKLAHMARYALEPMPFPEAGQALRDALAKTSGKLKVGVITSLGIRKDEQAIPELGKLIMDSDAQVAQAAAKILGDIGTPEASSALDAGLAQGSLPELTVLAVHNGLLACAEAAAAGGNAAQAGPIYDRLLQASDAQPHVRAAALRGTVLTAKNTQALHDALRGDDEALFDAALRAAREATGDAALTGAVAEVLPSLSDDKKIQVLAVFGPKDGAAAGAAKGAAGAAFLALKNDANPVRVAAIQALTRMGYDAALPLIEQLASSDDADVAAAARTSLSYFPDQKGDAAILALLKMEQPDARRTAVELVGEGAVQDPVPPLMEAALNDKDESIRVTALTALHSYAGVQQLPQLLDHFLKGGSADEVEATRAVLSAIGEREKQMPGGIVIQKAVYGALPDGPTADVLPQVQRIFDSGAVVIEATNANLGDPAPGAVKHLRVEYTDHGTPVVRTVREGEPLKLAATAAPQAVVDAFHGAYEKATGDAKVAMLRLLGSTGSPNALDTVKAATTSSDAKVKDVALRTINEWPTDIALPTLLDMVRTPPAPSAKLDALRGAVRLVGQSNAGAAEQISNYKALMHAASTTEEKMAVLGGVAQMQAPEAMDLAFAHFGDDSVRTEAVQAAINIARNLGGNAVEDKTFFNGTDLTGWTGASNYWKVEDGAIVGSSTANIPKNEFLWSGVEVGDFYLVLDVLLDPNDANAGMQFRSSDVESGQAKGYQADVGKGYWGRLYHEHGRGMLDDTDAAEKAVKKGDWNRYEILAVGPIIWTAINGVVGTAYVDMNEHAERSGKIAVQMHSGDPFTVKYRIVKLVHNPEVELENHKIEALMNMLKVSEK